MNARQRKTLEKIFEIPTRADITWAEVVSLVRALGARVEEGAGSRVGVYFDDHRAVYHRPHNPPVCKKGLVRALKRMLETMEIVP